MERRDKEDKTMQKIDFTSGKRVSHIIYFVTTPIINKNLYNFIYILIIW